MKIQLESLALTAFLSLPHSVSAATTLYVDLNCTNPTPPYTNWTTAATNIQTALNVANAGDQVWVAAGTYLENITIPSGVALYGGFAGSELSIAERNWTTNLTILDGRQSNSVVIASSQAQVDGFTIRNGNAISGGGIYVNGSFVGIANNIITNNQASWGGGIYTAPGSSNSVTIATNLILQNQAPRGAGICCRGSSPLIASNVITENHAPYTNYITRGGGIYCDGGTSSILSTSVITGNVVSSNSAVAGGGIRCDDISAPLITNNRISGNTALFDLPPSSAGGGISIGGASHPTIANNLLVDNMATNSFDRAYGGGMSVGSTSADPPKIVGNTLIRNTTFGAFFGYGGGIYVGSAAVIANNLIVSGNMAGIYNAASPGAIIENNCAFANAEANFYPNVASTKGNISVDPLLLTPNDYYFASNSPCINAGNNAYGLPGTDLDGNPRIAGGTVDIGAYEFQNPASVISYAWLQQYGLSIDGSADYVDSDNDHLNNWQEWRARTSPLDASSILKMLSLTKDVSGETVSWQSVAGRFYSLERSDLTDGRSFSTIQTNILSEGATTRFTDTNANGAPQLFYRVRVQ